MMPHWTSPRLHPLLRLLCLFAAATTGGAPAGRAQTVTIEGPPIERAMVRDSAGREPARSGTGRIAGRVVAADTGAPVRRADVRLMAAEAGVRMARTDEEGRFDFRDLPAARYSLSANKSGYVGVQYGQLRAFEQGRPIELADKQVMTRVDIAMPRGGAIAGRITDEFGEPVAEAMVMVLRRSWASGRRRLVPAGRSAQTNDLGQYRVWGLPPGDYFVSGSVRGVDRPIMVEPGRGPGSMFLPAGSENGYAPTYFPGAASAAGAQTVTVGLGQEAQNTDFALVPVRLSRISGTVIGSDGKPLENAMVTPRPAGGFDAGFGMRPHTPTGKDGRFDIGGIAPGDYVLEVHQVQILRSENGNSTMIATMAGGSSPASAAAESATVPLTVTGDDLPDVVILTSKGVTASGRVRFDGPAPPPASSLRIMAMPEDSDGGPNFTSPSTVKPDGEFVMSGLFGRRTVRVLGLPPGWRVEAIRLNGEDITDAAIDFKPGTDASGIDVAVTSKVTEVGGTVTAANGDPVKDYTVVVFSEDPEHWVLPSSRWVSGSRPDQDGRFRIRTLPPGRYYVVALESLEAGAWTDPELLERLRGHGTSVTLADGTPATLGLKLTTAY